MQSKRSKGPPKAAKPGDRVLVSIVVTDVKDFSDLTRRYPELMNKAMGGHNNMMRKACHAHAGHVMDQEVRLPAMRGWVGQCPEWSTGCHTMSHAGSAVRHTPFP